MKTGVLVLLATAGFVSTVPGASMADTSWTGASGGPTPHDWFLPGNWSNGLPTATDALDFTTIPDDAPGFPVLTSGNPGTGVAGSIVVGGDMFSYIEAGNTLNVTNGVTVLPSAWNQGGFGNPTLWIRKNGTLNAGGGTNNSGWLWVAGTLTGGLTNSGTVHALGIADGAANSVTINGAIVNQAGGTFEVWGGMPALSIAGGSLQMNGRFDNAGTLLLGSSYAGFTGGDLSGITTLTNTGLVQVETALTLTADEIVNQVGGTITNDGNIIGISGLDNATGGTITNNATGSLTAGIGDVTNAGTLTNDGVIASTMSGITNASGGTITNSGTISGATGVSNAVHGTIINTATGMLLAEGDIVNAGTITNAKGGLVSAVNTQIVNAAGGTIVNNGTMASLTGFVNASGGTLINNGIVTGGVSNTGRLSGSGSFDAITLNSLGSLAPGNSVGSLNVVSAVFNTGTIYEVELNNGGFIAGTNNDLLNATGAVTIDSGATVHVKPENGTDDGSTYTLGTYTIITATGGVTGTFGALTDDYAFLDFTLGYDANNVTIKSALSATTFCVSGMTANQCAAGDGVFSLGSGGLFTAVMNLSGAAAPGALDQLSGEIHASTQTVLVDDSRFARDVTTGRTRAAFGGVGSVALPMLAYAGGSDPLAVSADPDRMAVWGQAFGAMRSWTGAGATAMTGAAGGLLAGADAALSDTVRLGLFGGYAHSGFRDTGLASTGSAGSWQFGIYGGGQWDGFGLRGGASYAWHRINTSRTVAFTGFTDTLVAGYNAATAQVFAETGYRFDTARASFEPYGALAHANVNTRGFTETGGAAALTTAPSTFTATFTTLGLRAETDIDIGNARKARLTGGVGWRHAFGALVPATAATFAGGGAFTVTGVPVARDALVVDLGADVDMGGTTRLGFHYSGQIAAGAGDHSFKASLATRF